VVSGAADPDAGRGIVESCRRLAARALLMARIDARRPASWGSLVAAAIAVRGTAGAWLPLAVVGGALAAAAGSGDPPRGVAAVGRRPALLWWCVRSVWPLAGAALMAAAGGDASACAVVTGAATARGLPAADATSMGFVPALAATLAGVVSACSGRDWLPVAVLAWLITAGAALRMAAATDAVDAWRRGMRAAAMITTLAAMAGCFFLAPEHSRWYAILSVAWFVGAALPQAALGAGTLDELPRERLMCCVAPAAAVRGVPRPVAAAVGRTARGVVDWAAILGWPAMVAAALWGGDAARGDGPLMALLVLAALAVSLVLVSGAVRWAGGSGETMLAVCAGLVVATGALLSATLPSLPCPLNVAVGNPPPTAVEGFGRSCQTP
jgi:hypothetical protein